MTVRPRLCIHGKHVCKFHSYTVYPKKYAHGFVVLCFIVVMQSFIMNSHEVFIHIHQGCFAGTGAIVRLPQCQWSKPDGYGKISQCITTTKHSKAKTMCIFLGIYCKSVCSVTTNNSIFCLFLIRLGYIDEAACYFRRALQIQPDFLSARENLDNICGHLVERWHFRMLNDTHRNQAYHQAIMEAVRDGHQTVLDIGAGTGLLRYLGERENACRLILGLHPANERLRHLVTTSLIGWV